MLADDKGGLSRKQIRATLKYHFPPKKKILTKCILQLTFKALIAHIK